MGHRDFLIRYSNGYKRHVSKSDLLELPADTLTQTGARAYFCTVSLTIEPTAGPNFLDLQVVFERENVRIYERERTVRGMIQRIQDMGFTAELA